MFNVFHSILFQRLIDSTVILVDVKKSLDFISYQINVEIINAIIFGASYSQISHLIKTKFYFHFAINLKILDWMQNGVIYTTSFRSFMVMFLTIFGREGFSFQSLGLFTLRRYFGKLALPM